MANKSLKNNDMPESLITPQDFEKNPKTGEIHKKEEETLPKTTDVDPEKVDIKLYKEIKKQAEEAEKYTGG